MDFKLFRDHILLKFIEGVYLVLEDIVFGFGWCVMRGAWLGISSRFLVFFSYLSFKNDDVQNSTTSSFFVQRRGTNIYRICLFSTAFVL